MVVAVVFDVVISVWENAYMHDAISQSKAAIKRRGILAWIIIAFGDSIYLESLSAGNPN